MIKQIAATALILAVSVAPTLAGGIIGGIGTTTGFDDSFNDDDDGVPWPTSLGDNAGGSEGGGLIGNAPKINLDAPTPPNKQFDIDYVPNPKGTIARADDIQIDDTALACRVAGTPSEFPNDILIANTGRIEIPAHTRIVWRTTAPRMTGTAVLSKSLKPGRSVRADDVLRGGVPADTPCEVLTPSN